jgi:hypothetical protein
VRRLANGPWLPMAVVLFQLHTIADVLFTGGRPMAATSAVTFLVVWGYLARPRTESRDHAGHRR